MTSMPALGAFLTEEQKKQLAEAKHHPKPIARPLEISDPRMTRADTTLLDDLDDFVSLFLRFPSLAARRAVVLWAAHAHAITAFESTPRLALLSPEKQSGKTRTLEVLDLLVPNPLHVSNASAAALFRAVEANQPTLLFDECDTYFGPRAREHEELRGLINTGHRRGATALRCVGEGTKMTTREFATYAAVALAGIGDLPDTVLDRSVIIRMKRRAPDEVVEAFRYRKVKPVADSLRDRLATWAEMHWDTLSTLEPELPEGLTDRPADVWEPLIAVGDVAGGNWPDWARDAAKELNAVRLSADQSLGVRLLSDIRQVFDDKKTNRLSTDELLGALNEMGEAPWGALRGEPLDPRRLARFLHRYDVSSKQIRFDPDTTLKGYATTDFYDAWQRYLSPLGNSETDETNGTEG